MTDTTPRPLAGRRALVTGAGGPRGIGAAIARRLAEAGADLAVTDAPSAADGVEALAAALRARGGRAAALVADLADPGAPEALLDAAAAALGGPPHVLVNDAAHSARDGWEALDAATIDAHLAVNLRAPALLAVGLARRLGADRRGRIVSLTSGQGRGPMPGELAYAASKGALEALTVTLADELAPLGITVNAVNPGVTDTGWIDEAARAELGPKHPMGRFGTPDDAARLVAFLATDDGGWITGQVLHSEGGFRRR
jgi:3-oxoacyl-[acyl-carrier protein] reductase